MKTRRALSVAWISLFLVALVAIPTVAQQGGQRGSRGGAGAPATGSSARGAPGPGGGGLPGDSALFGGRGGPGGPQRMEKVPEDVAKSYDQIDEQSLQQAAQRKYKVVTATKPVPTKLFRADPKLLQNKFVAVFNVLPADLDPSDEKSVAAFVARWNIDRRSRARSIGESEFHGELFPLIDWGGYSLFHSQPEFFDSVKLDEYFKLLVAHCPADQQPPKKVVEFLTSPECNRDVMRSSLTSIVRGTVAHPTSGAWQFTVYALTAEEAEERAAGILRLLDGGMSRPIQRNLLQQGRGYLASAKQLETEIAEKAEIIRVEQERLTKPSEISPDILSQLKAQKVMVAVELAGLIARVRACDEMLKDPKKLEISTLQSVSDMKVKAEIERVGIKEKLDQINLFIGEGDGREASQSRLAGAQTSNINARRNLSLRVSSASDRAELIALYAPLQLDQNQITISPIEWTN